MTPDQLKTTAVKIYGRKKWQVHLARDLGVDVSTIHRIMHREQVPGPYEVALRGLAEHRRQEVILEKAARKLLPRKFRVRKSPRKPKPVKLKPGPQQGETA